MCATSHEYWLAAMLTAILCPYVHKWELYLELQPVQCAGVCDHWLRMTSTATMPALRKGLSVVNRRARTQFSATPQEIATWTKGFAFRSTVAMRRNHTFYRARPICNTVADAQRVTAYRDDGPDVSCVKSSNRCNEKRGNRRSHNR
jgi:hypothetical protein